MGAMRPFIFEKGLTNSWIFGIILVSEGLHIVSQMTDNNIVPKAHIKELKSYMGIIIKGFEIVLMAAGVMLLLIVAHDIIHKLRNKKKEK